MPLSAKTFCPSCVWHSGLTKPVIPGDGVRPLPVTLTPCASPGAGLHARDPSQVCSRSGFSLRCWLHLSVWYVIPRSSASQSFTWDSLWEHRPKDSLGELTPSLASYFSTFGKIIAVHPLVGYGFVISSSKFAWLLKVYIIKLLWYTGIASTSFIKLIAPPLKDSCYSTGEGRNQPRGREVRDGSHQHQPSLRSANRKLHLLQ